MTDDKETKVELTEEGLKITNLRITDPAFVKMLRESDDPEELIHRALREGALAMHGSYGTGRRTQ